MTAPIPAPRIVMPADGYTDDDPRTATNGWRMLRAGRAWHYFRHGVALCGVVDDGLGMGRANAPDCPSCARLVGELGHDNATMVAP